MESAGGGNAPSAEMEQSATHNQEIFSSTHVRIFPSSILLVVREMENLKCWECVPEIKSGFSAYFHCFPRVFIVTIKTQLATKIIT
jgi:hypothetical protein